MHQFFDVFRVPDSELSKHQTTKGDRKNGISKLPEAIYKQIEEMKSESETVGIDSFVVKKVLGRGSFGKVLLVQKRDTGKFYAMKSLRKDNIIKT